MYKMFILERFFKSLFGSTSSKVKIAPESHKKEGVTTPELKKGDDMLKNNTMLNNAEFYYNKANDLSDLKQYEEAIKYYNLAISLKPDYALAHNKKGHVLCDFGSNEDALVSYSFAADLGYIGAHHNKGIVLNNLDRYDEAIICYDRAIELNPDDCNPYNGKGNVLDSLGKYEEALECYNESIKLNPNFNAYNGKGNVLSCLGKREEALECYNESIRLNSDFLHPYNGRGDVFRALGRSEDAIESYKCAISVNPDDSRAYNSVGVILYELKRYEESILYYDKAIELEPNDVLYHCNKGVTLKNLGREEDALESFHKAQEIAERGGDIGKDLSKSNIEYIVYILNKEMVEIQSKLEKSLQEKDSESSFSDYEDELEDFNEPINDNKKQLIAPEAMNEKSILPEYDLKSLLAQMVQMQERIILLESQSATHTLEIEHINYKLDDFAIQLGTNRDAVSSMMLKMENDGIARNAIAELIPFLGNLKIMIGENEAIVAHNIILDNIKSNPYKNALFDSVRKNLTSTYFASSVVETDIVKSDKVGLIGYVGKAVKIAGEFVPMFGSAVRIVGTILTSLDAYHQKNLLHNYATFVSTATEMNIIADNLGIVFADDKLDKTRHRDLMKSVKQSRERSDLGEKHAETLSAFIIDKIFYRDVQNHGQGEVRLVIEIAELTCKAFYMADSYVDMTEAVPGCVLFGDCADIGV